MAFIASRDEAEAKHRPRDRVPPVGRGALDAAPNGLADRTGRRSFHHHPVTVATSIAILGYLVLALSIVGLGLLLTHFLLHGTWGRWDEHADVWFVAGRTASLNTVTAVGSTIGSTATVIGVAALSVLVLAIRRLWREIGLIVIALTVEVSVFLTAALLVDRSRPTVPRLDPSPPTSSYPSGHTAAAIALWVTLAIVISMHVRNAAVRVAVWMLAFGIPAFVGISRIYRGMHHPTDVLASALLGTGAVLIALLAIRTASSCAATRSGADPASAPASTGVGP